MKKCYFDHVATNPLHPDALEAMMPYFKEEFGNPLSIYEYGTRAKKPLKMPEKRSPLLSMQNQRKSFLQQAELKRIILP